jgi:uncharacterized membrane protein YjgN (DUF898 family)
MFAAVVFCSHCGLRYETLPEQCSCGYRLSAESLPVLRFRCEATGSTLLLLYLKTFLLSILTLGVYSFWGRAEIRRYLYSETFAGDDRFRNHATGAELFVGWLKAMAFLLVLYAAFFTLALSDPERGPAIGMALFYVAVLAVIPFAIVGTHRYRLSRTSLRGIHFSSTARPWEFARLYYKGLLLTIVTLGFYSPWFAVDISAYLTRTARYGDRPFAFDGDGRHLLRPYVIFLLLLIPTLYLISFWYLARQQNYLWNRTTFAGARFRSSVRGRDLLWLALSNAALVVFTLGIALPWATLRNIRYGCDHLDLEGHTVIDGVRQRAMAASATGEAAAALLEIDTDAGFGI